MDAALTVIAPAIFVFGVIAGRLTRKPRRTPQPRPIIGAGASGRTVVQSRIGFYRLHFDQRTFLQIVTAMYEAKDALGNFVLIDSPDERGEFTIGSVTFVCREWPHQFFQMQRFDGDTGPASVP